MTTAATALLNKVLQLAFAQLSFSVLDSRFRGNDVPLVMPAAAGIQVVCTGATAYPGAYALRERV